MRYALISSSARRIQRVAYKRSTGWQPSRGYSSPGVSSAAAAKVSRIPQTLRNPDGPFNDSRGRYPGQKSTQKSSDHNNRYSEMAKDSGNQAQRARSFSRLQFVTTPTADSPGTALLLHFDDRRYIIGNAHEGLQRAGLQVGAKFFKAKEFLLTGKTEWQSNGGLMGMILSLADSTNASIQSKAENAKQRHERQLAREEEARLNPKKARRKASDASDQAPTKPAEQQSIIEDTTVTLHGGPNLTHTIATARSFIFRHGTPIDVKEHGQEEGLFGVEHNWGPTWQDNLIQVWAMPISSSNSDNRVEKKSPGKRSLDDFIIGQGPASHSSSTEAPDDEEKRNQQIREFVVAEMFNSSWKYDNLVETPLHKVNLPAAMFVRDAESKKFVKYTGPVPDDTRPIPNINVFTRQPWPGAQVNHLPPTKPSSTAMSYIIRNHKQRGKFKPATAKALNVPPGPLWSQLAKGFEVESSDGKTVTPDMVLEPGKEGSGIAVIDLPSRDYIQNLIDRPEWNAEKVMVGVGAIIWILGPGLAHDPALRGFIESKSDLKHIISSVDNCSNYLVQTAAASAAIRHNQVDPARFPVPVHSNTAPSPLNDTTIDVEQRSGHLLQADRGLRIDLEPKFQVTKTDIIPPLNTALVLQETPHNVIRLAQAAQREINSKASQIEKASQHLPSPDAEIIPLGTGSASPSIFRNVSATLLRVPGYGSYLIDCGENTLGQLKRVFTESELTEVFQDLKMIWISHLHADHHLGTASVIRAWYEAVHGNDATKRSRPSLTEIFMDPAKFLEEGRHLFIVGHRNMIRWLEEYSSVEDFGYDQLVAVASSNRRGHCRLDWNGVDVGFSESINPRLKAAMSTATSLSNLVTCPVSHCYGAQAVSLGFPNGFKFSYSGDCRPSKEFAKIGKGSTVLLHEATFDDELLGDAQAKKHSTTSEAIGVGMAMGARRLILTHFSQRYQKIPSMGSMKSLGVRFEDAKDTEDPMEGMEPPVNADDASSMDIPHPEHGSKSHSEPEKVRNQTHQSSNQDMKIGVAFDYMRVKVEDIIHLEKFTPALRELYKDEEREEYDAKAKKAAKEAFSDEPLYKDVKREEYNAKARKAAKEAFKITQDISSVES